MDNCGVVRDLLPLYVDGVCGDASRRLVDEHIRSCPDCAKMLAQLQNSACEDSLRREASAVLAPRRWRNRAFAASCALAAFACVPACLLAVVLPDGPSMGWGWLMLLAPALLVEMSTTMLPLRTRRYTGRWTLLGFTGSLLLLLMACMVYTDRWYFMAAALGLYVLSVLAVVPWAVRELPLPSAFGADRRRALAAWDGGFALLLVTAYCLTCWQRPAALCLGVAGTLAALAAAEWGIAARLPVNRTVRLGLCVTLAGNGLCWVLPPLYRATAWSGLAWWAHTGALALLAASTVLGLALVAVGVRQAYKRSGCKLF